MNSTEDKSERDCTDGCKRWEKEGSKVKRNDLKCMHEIDDQSINEITKSKAKRGVR